MSARAGKAHRHSMAEAHQPQQPAALQLDDALPSYARPTRASQGRAASRKSVGALLSAVHAAPGAAAAKRPGRKSVGSQLLQPQLRRGAVSAVGLLPAGLLWRHAPTQTRTPLTQPPPTAFTHTPRPAPTAAHQRLTSSGPAADHQSPPAPASARRRWQPPAAAATAAAGSRCSSSARRPAAAMQRRRPAQQQRQQQRPRLAPPTRSAQSRSRPGARQLACRSQPLLPHALQPPPHRQQQQQRRQHAAPGQRRHQAPPAPARAPRPPARQQRRRLRPRQQHAALAGLRPAPAQPGG